MERESASRSPSALTLRKSSLGLALESDLPSKEGSRRCSQFGRARGPNQRSRSVASRLIGVKLKLPVVAGGIVEGGCVAYGAGPGGAECVGARDGCVAMAVFPFEAGIVEFQGKIQAGCLQLRFCEGERAATPAAVRRAVIPFAGDAPRGATGDFPATIHSSAKSRGDLEEIAGVLQLSGDAQGAFPGDEIIAEAKLELIGKWQQRFLEMLFRASPELLSCRIRKIVERGATQRNCCGRHPIPGRCEVVLRSRAGEVRRRRWKSAHLPRTAGNRGGRNSP